MDPETPSPDIVLTDAPKAVPPRRKDPSCPRCRAAKEKRVKSSAFGEPHDVCSQCGFEEFEEQLA